MKKLLCVLLVFSFVSAGAFAQQETYRRRSGPRRQLATIVFAGLGGAILGLSTLSFYGRPQEHLSNIAMGFAVGVIAGTAYVTVRSATTREYYDDNAPKTSSLAPEDDATKFHFGPMITRAPREANSVAYGGQMLLQF